MGRIADCRVEIEYKGQIEKELREFAEAGAWTENKHNTFDRLKKAIHAAGYRTFNSSVQTIGLQRKGQSAILAVPVNQRGGLAPFAGKLVHVICVDFSDNYSGRTYAAAEVSPDGKLLHGASSNKV